MRHMAAIALIMCQKREGNRWSDKCVQMGMKGDTGKKWKDPQG